MPETTQETKDLESFGYAQELHRSLSGWAVFALGFATISPVVGLYAVAQLGFVFAGGAWLWAVLIAFLGQLLVAVVYAQLASQFPIAGGVYQWVRRLGGPRLGWLVGWIYLASAVASLTTVAYLGGHWLALLFDISVDPLGQVLLGGVFLVVALAINLLGVDSLKRFLNAGILAEGIASIGVSLVLIVFFANNGWDVLVDTFGAEALSNDSVPLAFLTCLAVAGWAFLGFESTTQVAEETRNPRTVVPRALLKAFLVVGGTVLLTGLSVTVALRDPTRASTGVVTDPVFAAVTESFGEWSAKPFILMVLVAFFACAISIQTYVGRAVFSYARDQQLPFSRSLARLGSRQVPYVSLLATAVLAGLGLLLGLNGNAAATLISFGSGGFYLVFLAVCLVALVSRLTGRWKPDAGGFRLGAAGLVINIAAVVWLVFEAVNIAWPRVELAPLDGTWVQVWAVVLVFSSLLVVGLGYLAVARPHHRLPLPASDSHKEVDR